MKRKASAHWQGSLKDGKGTISTDSGVLSDTQYSFATRFADGKGSPSDMARTMLRFVITSPCSWTEIPPRFLFRSRVP